LIAGDGLCDEESRVLHYNVDYPEKEILTLKSSRQYFRYMRLFVLSETKSRNGFESEHGLSFYIETENKRILFDTGASNIFRSNASRLNIDLEKIDHIVLSHGHFDHGDGLQFIENAALICHPECFIKRYSKGGYRNIGLKLTQNEIQERFDLQIFREPYEISNDIYYLGEIPRNTDFESQETSFVTEGGAEDFIIDDTGLAIVTKAGLVIVSGCAHSGICNMIDHAINVTGIPHINLVIGGFHLKSIDHQTKKTIEYLKKKDIQQVMPSHCTMDPALSEFYRHFGKNEVLAGEEYVVS